MREVGASPELLLLLGLMHDVAGNLREAAVYYRKALFLDPHHNQALAHLALLLEKQGSKADARLLTERMKRLERRETKRNA
jgi:chemotaxis protein methyltransferase WspC